MRKPDLIILDLGLPDMDGVEVIKSIREWPVLPIITLSTRSSEQHKIDALDAGDYLTIQLDFGELQARIQVGLRHSVSSPPSEKWCVVTGELQVDLLKRQVFWR